MTWFEILASLFFLWLATSILMLVFPQLTVSKFLQSLFDEKIPGFARTILITCLGTSRGENVIVYADFLYNDFNITPYFVYLTLWYIGFSYALWAADFYVPGPHVVPYQSMMVWFYGALSLTTYITLAIKDPGVIKAKHVKSYQEFYPYDNVYHHPGKMCTVCKFERPARSHHCKSCNRCVSKYDHHCRWVNNCIGEGNIVEFHLFLVVHTVLSFHALWAIHQVVTGFYSQYGVHNDEVIYYTYADATESVWPRFFLRYIFVLHHNPSLFIAVFCFVGLGFILGSFWLISFVEAANNYTGDEMRKKARARKEYNQHIHQVEKMLDYRENEETSSEPIDLDQEMEHDDAFREVVEKYELRDKTVKELQAVIDEIIDAHQKLDEKTIYNKGPAQNLTEYFHPFVPYVTEDKKELEGDQV